MNYDSINLFFKYAGKILRHLQARSFNATPFGIAKKLEKPKYPYIGNRPN
jgi:hypothetical protein